MFHLVCRLLFSVSTKLPGELEIQTAAASRDQKPSKALRFCPVLGVHEIANGDIS